MAARQWSLRESYSVLGLPESATEDEVRRTYKLKARECHPDKNPDDPDATRKFQELAEAYNRIQSGKDDDYDFHEYIDPFVVFFHAMRMQQFMRSFYRDPFSDGEEEYIFVGPFGFPRSDFEAHCRARYYGRHGYSRPNSSSYWSNYQEESAWEERKQSPAERSEGGHSRTAKHKRKTKRYYSPSRSATYAESSDQGESREGGMKSPGSAAPTNQREPSTGSNNANTKHSFPVRKTAQSDCRFPQAKPKKKSKKQQNYEEWRRQQEVAQMKEEKNEEEKGTSSANVAQSNFPEETDDSKKAQQPEVRSLNENNSHGRACPTERTSSKEETTQFQTTPRSQRDQRKRGESEGSPDAVKYEVREIKSHDEGQDEKQKATSGGFSEEPDNGVPSREAPSDAKKGQTDDGAFEDESNLRTSHNSKSTNNKRESGKIAAKQRDAKPDVSHSVKRETGSATNGAEDRKETRVIKEPGGTTASVGKRKGSRRKGSTKEEDMTTANPRKGLQKGMVKINRGGTISTKTSAARSEHQSAEGTACGESLGSTMNRKGPDIMFVSSRGPLREAKCHVDQQAKTRHKRPCEVPNKFTHQIPYERRSFRSSDERNPANAENEPGKDCRPQPATFKKPAQPEEPVVEPQAYWKPHIEKAHDRHQWNTVGKKRKARRDRKWSAERAQGSTSLDDVLPDEGAGVATLEPVDEQDERRQLEIALELSKQQL